jgi:hypothetical protein
MWLGGLGTMKSGPPGNPTRNRNGRTGMSYAVVMRKNCFGMGEVFGSQVEQDIERLDSPQLISQNVTTHNVIPR